MADRSGLIDAGADCVTCGWGTVGRNAMGVGAQHARRTGHYVQTWQTIGKSYNVPDAAARAAAPDGE